MLEYPDFWANNDHETIVTLLPSNTQYSPIRQEHLVLLNAHKLEKSYGTRTLFKDLSFGIESGEKVGLLGPNGVGKSTLLKILTGDTSVDSGQISKSKSMTVGFLDQEPLFKPSATIMDTILEKTKDPTDSLPKAYELMSSFNLYEFGEDFLVENMSGGWKKRVALARELILEPDLLLLDEPTNHLDIAGILWLEDFLRQGRFAMLMITHDRLFLQRTCNRILDLDPRNPNFVLDVRGEYVSYVESKDLILASQRRREDALSNKLRREKEWLSRGPQARQTKQKARIKDAYELDDTVAELSQRNRKVRSKIDFGKIDRLPKKLIYAEKIKKTFEHKLLFENLNILIRPTTRLALLGENGCGKSTLIKCLLEKEKVDSGSVQRAEGIQISYFEQNKETLDLNKSVLKNVCPDGDYVSFQGTFVHVRSYLERFLFYGNHTDLPASRLSGGERARLRLAQMMLNEAQILILDEPTNDLDTDTLNVLEEALESFNGAVILVTHDRYFMDSVCDEILSFPGERGKPGQLLTFADYFQWERWHMGLEEAPYQKPIGDAESSNEVKSSNANVGATATPSLTPTPNTPKAKLSFKDKFELEHMEKTISDLETQLTDLERQSQSEECLKSPSKLAEVYKKMADTQESIDQKYKRWEELTGKG